MKRKFSLSLQPPLLKKLWEGGIIEDFICLHYITFSYKKQALPGGATDKTTFKKSTFWLKFLEVGRAREGEELLQKFFPLSRPIPLSLYCAICSATA